MHTFRDLRSCFILLASLAAGPLFAGDYPPSSSAADEAPPPHAKPLYLITDYLPVAIYERDNVVGSFRIENTTGAEARLDLTTTACDAAGKVVHEQVQTLAAPPSGFGQAQASQDSVGVARVKFVLHAHGPEAQAPSEVAAVAVRLVRDEDPWPVTEIRAGRLVDAETKEVLVPVVERRVRKEDRAFAPVKWLLDSAPIVRLAGKAMAFIPGRWGLKSAGAPETVLLGPYPPNGAPPVLCAVSEILNNLLAERAAKDQDAAPLAQVLVCLPPEDFDVATDPCVYRATIAALLAHVAHPALKKVLLVPPFQYGTPEKSCEALWHEVREAARAYGATVVDPADCLDEKLWRTNSAVEGVYGNHPNSAGLKKIEQGILNLVR
ncbi:MAG: hypothetical protein ABSE73_27725 [Planctomycetota bacterium]